MFVLFSRKHIHFFCILIRGRISDWVSPARFSFFKWAAALSTLGVAVLKHRFLTDGSLFLDPDDVKECGYP